MVIVSVQRISGLHLIEEGHQVICVPGATLYDLERRLRPLGREPHSVIGGICNSSGGAMVQRGPDYTELALYARLGPDRQLELVNHLGMRLGEEPEAMLERLEHGRFGPGDVEEDPGAARLRPGLSPPRVGFG